MLFSEVSYALELVLTVFQTGNLRLGFFEVESAGVIRVELVDGNSLGVALGEKFVVVERTIVGWNAVEVSHIFGLGTFFLGEKGFIHLLSVTDTDYFDVFFLASKERAYGFCLGLDSASWGFLNEDVSVLSVVECEEYKVNSFFDTHYKASHLWLGESDRVAIANLVNPKRNNRTARTHYITVAGAADLGVSAIAALGHCHFLFDGLGDTHSVG